MISNLSQNIKQWRTKNGLTQQAFADKFSELYRHVHRDNYKARNIEYSPKTISTWENGKVPAFDCIMVLAQMLSMHIDSLLYDAIQNFTGYSLVNTDKINIINNMPHADKAQLLQLLGYMCDGRVHGHCDDSSSSGIVSQVFLPLIFNQDEVIVSDKISGITELTTQYFDKRQSHFIQLGIDNYNSYICSSEHALDVDGARLLHKFITWDYITAEDAGQDIDCCEPYTYYDAVSDSQATAVDNRRVTRCNSCLYEACEKDFAEMLGLFDTNINYTTNDIVKLKQNALIKANTIIDSKFVNLLAKGIVQVDAVGFYEIGVFNSGFAKWLKDFEDYVMLSVKINLTIDEIATLVAGDMKNKIMACLAK